MLPPDSDRAGASTPRARARRSARITSPRIAPGRPRRRTTPPRANAGAVVARRSRFPRAADRRSRRPPAGPRECARRPRRSTRAASAASARPATRTRPALRRAHSAQHVGQRLLAVARHAGDRGDLARAQRERRRRRARPAIVELVDLAHDVARRVRLRRRARGTSRPTISSASVARSRRRPPRNGRTSLPLRSTAMRSDTRSTSSSLWLMKMIDSPSATSCRSVANSDSALLRRQHRRGLVEDQHARVAVQRLQDLHALALADGQRRRRARPDSRAGRSARRSRPGARAPRAVRDDSRHSGSVPSMTLSSTDRLSASVKCWCTMPMPAASAAAGSPGRQRRAERLDRALVGDVMAEQDRHQRRLARAVLAQQRQHFAARRARAKCASFATSAPKRLVMPVRRRTGARRSRHLHCSARLRGAFCDDMVRATSSLTSHAPARRASSSIGVYFAVDLGSVSTTGTLNLPSRMSFCLAATLPAGPSAPSSRTCRAAPFPSPCASSSSTGRSPRP